MITWVRLLFFFKCPYMGTGLICLALYFLLMDELNPKATLNPGFSQSLTLGG